MTRHHRAGWRMTGCTGTTQQDWQTYQTRYVSAEAFRDALQGRSHTMKRATYSAKSFSPAYFSACSQRRFVVKQRLCQAQCRCENRSTHKESLARHGFHLQEVSHAAGIDFVHQAPVLDAKLAHIMPEVASMGASVSVVDFDRDGWPDLYVTNSAIGSRNRLYRNMHDGTFKDVAGELGVADVNQPGTGVSMGAVWGDYDNDGYEDLFLIKWGRPELFHNDQGQGFHRVSEQASLPPWINANTAVWFDYRWRWASGPLRWRLLPGERRPLASQHDEDDAGQLRVCEKRRPQIPLSQPRERKIRRG